MSWTLFFSLVKRLEFGPAPPRGISHGAQSPQGGVKILLWEGREKNPPFLSPSWPSSYDAPGLWAELSSLSPYVLLIVLAPCPHRAKREAPPINARTLRLVPHHITGGSTTSCGPYHSQHIFHYISNAVLGNFFTKKQLMMDLLCFLWLDQAQQGFLNISAPTLLK